MSIINQIYQQRPKVLLVDDDDKNLFAMQKLLADFDIEIDLAPSSQEALSYIIRNEYAIVFLDVEMPEVDGYEVANCILQNKQTANCLIIFFTETHKDELSIVQGYESGAIDYITKPVNPTILKAKTKILLDLYCKNKQLEQLVESLEKSANYDVLTGLSNRNQFNYIFAKIFSSKRRSNSPFALLLLDLDDFKKINDSLGHDVGDLLLIETAKILSATVRASDTVSRLGGDEFAVLLPELATVSDAGRVAGNLVKAFTQPLLAGGHSIESSASIGIATYPFAGDNPTDMFKAADVALYRAKEKGKNSFEFYTRTLNEAHYRWNTIESSLANAIANKEIYLVYQPRFDMRQEKIVGLEVLARWEHPELGSIPPMEFIKIAEDTGHIMHLGEMVLIEALKTYESWQLKGQDICISFAVNLSPYQLASRNFVLALKNMISRYSVPSSQIELEITESIFDGMNDDLEKQLNEIKKIGIHLAIDDFGTGYSSLSRLKSLPISTLKIDQSFVRDIATNAENRKIVEAIIALAKALKLSLVAEGVETAEHRDILLSLGCNIAQGYFYAKPMSNDSLLELILNQK